MIQNPRPYHRYICIVFPNKFAMPSFHNYYASHFLEPVDPSTTLLFGVHTAVTINPVVKMTI